MDIVAQAKQLQEDYDKKLVGVEERFKYLEGMELKLKNKEEELKKLQEELEVKRKEVDGILAKGDLDVVLEMKRKDLSALSVELSQKQHDLRKWENDLALIDQRQTVERENLDSQRRSLEKEKETYKETLKKEFFEELNKRLPQ